MNAAFEQSKSFCGCESAVNGRPLLSIEDAFAVIARQVPIAAETELLSLDQAKGRVLAEPVRAKADLPPFDNSAMDGYALNADDLSENGPWTLDVIDRVPAGHTGAEEVQKGKAVRIFTGAPLPNGANAVVMQEEVTRVADSITLSQRPREGMNVRRAGEELAVGSSILSPGVVLGPREIAACAAAGYGQVTVRRAIRVGLLVTGDEICPAGKQLEGAEIWDVNTPMLEASLSQPTIELVEILKCDDDRTRLRQKVQKIVADVDLLITSGAVSVGEEDHVKPVLDELGLEMHFSGVAIKPGKPVSFGRLRNALWIGLPGNPLSAYVTWQLFGATICRRLSGTANPEPTRYTVSIGNEIRHRIGRTELRVATLDQNNALGGAIASTDKATHSARVSGLPFADGLVVIPAETDHLPKGALVDFLPFQET